MGFVLLANGLKLFRYLFRFVPNRILPDKRIRYYGKEAYSRNFGPTRIACRVIEFNTRTGNARSWHECYDHSGNVNRVHPKQINGQEVTSPHYPLTKKELGF